MTVLRNSVLDTTGLPRAMAFYQEPLPVDAAPDGHPCCVFTWIQP